MAEFVAAAEEHLAAGRAEEVGEALIDGDAEVAAWMAGMGHGVLFQDGAKGHAAFEDELLRLFGQEIEVNADGTEFHRHAVAAAVQHGSADEVVADASAGGDIEIDLATVELAQTRSHVLVMHQQAAF